ncbi:MAG TPA: ABC transporter permease [Rhizomicrobium sp.]|jgi:putative ABC transport system permease protein|nr:ABC transporter permease [Rhizomicrobium sp.]
MKYFPLVWAALLRKPAHTILTLLSVVMAFTLFGIMIGFNASVERIVNGAFPERVYVYSRFCTGPGPNVCIMPLAYREQILRLPGIASIGYRSQVPGYYQDPKNRAYVYMVDEGWCRTRPEYNLTPARCRQLEDSRTGVFITRSIAERYHLKTGDAFPVLTKAVTQADGGKLWPFTVIGILDDIPRETRGYIIGNYSYFDQTQPLNERGTLGTFAINISVPDPAVSAKTALAIEALFANSGDPVHADTEVAEAQASSQWAVNIPFVTMVVAGAGLFMVLFLTGNGIYQSVRERIAEFAVLKTLGFSDWGVMALVFAEAAIPCLLGAVIGLGLATAFAAKVPSLMPPSFYLPAPYLPASVLGVGLVCAILVALLSAVIPAWRLRGLDVAAALAGK